MSVSSNLNKNKPIEVVALALCRASDFRYLLARRGPGQSGAGEWEFPGGKVELNESHTEAMIREIKEELGFELNPHELEFISDHVHHYPNKSVHIFLWTQKVENVPEFNLTEHDEICWCSPEEMIRLGLSQGDRHFIQDLTENS
jgi:8-oxo-dGTP diphosphatase